MMHILATGTLIKPATQRTGKSGKPFVTANMRIPHADENATFASLIAFNETAGAALLALDQGDALSVTGEAKPSEWESGGETKRGLSVTVSQVLTLYMVDKRRSVSGNGGNRTHGATSGGSDGAKKAALRAQAPSAGTTFPHDPPF